MIARLSRVSASKELLSIVFESRMYPPRERVGRGGADTGSASAQGAGVPLAHMAIVRTIYGKTHGRLSAHTKGTNNQGRSKKTGIGLGIADDLTDADVALQ